MKTLPLIKLGMIALIIFTIGCSKRNHNAEEEEPEFTGNGVYSFKVDGVQVNSNVWGNVYSNIFPNFVTVNATSNMHKEKRTLNININADVSGNYNFTLAAPTANTAQGTFYPNYDNVSDTYQFVDGSIKITGINKVDKTFTATFSGTVKNQYGQTHTITEGVIQSGILSTP